MCDKIDIHFIMNEKLVFRSISTSVPIIGDEIRFGGECNEKFYLVEKRVVVYDEPECPYGRVNIQVSPVMSVEEGE